MLMLVKPLWKDLAHGTVPSCELVVSKLQLHRSKSQSTQVVQLALDG